MATTTQSVQFLVRKGVITPAMRAKSLQVRQAKAKGDYNAFTPARMLFAKIRRGYGSVYTIQQFDKHLRALLGQLERGILPEAQLLKAWRFLLRVMDLLESPAAQVPPPYPLPLAVNAFGATSHQKNAF